MPLAETDYMTPNLSSNCDSETVQAASNHMVANDELRALLSKEMCILEKLEIACDETERRWSDETSFVG